MLAIRLVLFFIVTHSNRLLSFFPLLFQTGAGKTYTMGTGFDVSLSPEELGKNQFERFPVDIMLFGKIKSSDTLYSSKKKKERKENFSLLAMCRDISSLVHVHGCIVQWHTLRTLRSQQATAFSQCMLCTKQIIMRHVCISSWYPRFRSHFGLPPSSIHRTTGLDWNRCFSILLSGCVGRGFIRSRQVVSGVRPETTSH